MTIPPVIARWHAIALDARDKPDGDWPQRLSAILAEDCVFESPVVHTPQAGRAIVESYLRGALSVLNTSHFRYGDEWFAAGGSGDARPSSPASLRDPPQDEVGGPTSSRDAPQDESRGAVAESAGSAVLEFYTEIEGVRINGVDMIHWNAEGRIVHFKVMLRPLKAINMVHQKMGEYLMAKMAR